MVGTPVGVVRISDYQFLRLEPDSLSKLRLWSGLVTGLGCGGPAVGCTGGLGWSGRDRNIVSCCVVGMVSHGMIIKLGGILGLT